MDTRRRLFAVSTALVMAATAFSSTYGQGSERPGSEEAAGVDHANAAIDKVYGQLMSKLDPEQQKSLKEAQRAWIKWRDAEADLDARLGGAVGGSAFRADYSTAQIKLIQLRTEVLAGFLKDAESNH